MLTFRYRGMWAIASNEGICPVVEISLLEKTTKRQQVQPQAGRFDTGADTVGALKFSGPERSLRPFHQTIISDYFDRI